MTVTVVRKAGLDKYGDPVSGETRFTVDNCVVAPRSDIESLHGIHDTGREGVIVGLTVYAPFDADIRHTDQIEIDAPWSGLWDVEGEPGAWDSPWQSGLQGLQVALRRAAG